MPALSRESWRAAHDAAERALPALLAKGHAQYAALLMRKAQQFAKQAEA